MPDFGAVISRSHLMQVFRAQRPSLTLVCAPAGYGKSVYASQVVGQGTFDEVIWISSPDTRANDDLLLLSLRLALADGHSSAADGTDRPVVSRDETILAMREALEARRGLKLCLVVDGCNQVRDPTSLQELALLVRDLTSPFSAVIVTCRRVSCVQPLDPAQVLVLEQSDLRFSEDEVSQLLCLAGSGRESAGRWDTAAQLVSRFEGHPALTSLVMRHVDLDVETAPPRDLLWYVDRLVSDLPEQALTLAYAAALLGEDEVGALASCDPLSAGAVAFCELKALSPLLVLGEDAGSSPRAFRVHAVLQDSVFRHAASELQPERTRDVRRHVLDYLRNRNRPARMLMILQSECVSDEIAVWCSEYGFALLGSVGAEAMTRLMDRIPATDLSGSPRLLLLRASVLREQEQYDDASVAALLAADLAESDGEEDIRTASLLLAAWLGVDGSRPEALRGALRRLESGRDSRVRGNTRHLISLCNAIIEIQSGDTEGTMVRLNQVLESLDSMRGAVSDDAAQLVNALGGIAGMYAGNWATAARLMTNLVNRPGLSRSRSIQVRANLAVCHLEMASLREAKVLLDAVIEQTEAAGLRHMAAYSYGTRSSVNYGLGDAQAGLSDFERCNTLLGALSHEDARAVELLNAAVNRRSLRLTEEALALVEQAEFVVSQGTSVYLMPGNLVALEAAASALSLGDVWVARRKAEEVREELRGGGACGHLYRADLILAEADRIDGAIEAAVARLAEHAEYVATGSANWLTAMYVRAFPGLLGLLADALGAAALPLRMLLMIPPDALDRALEMAPYLSAEDAEVLRRRRGGEGQSMNEELPPAETPSTSKHVCHARLFGGLEVMTDAGPVDEDSWRKRKARLLFLILLLRQHQDVPRDVLLERLWPEMDEDHAKRNFYVTWSTMKRALACGRPPSAAKTLVQCSGGVCRVTRQVRSDLDDFEEALAGLRAASAVNDAATVLACARRLVDIYRGELLPGDLYEEWFAEVRERTKHDFCDAMMAASNAAEAKGDAESALLFLRKASAADPWREDVYQSTMRCQMNAGQRSRAIETYLSCRSRLTEDLGIDPSIETTRIYQAVLAMDPGADDVAAVSIATSG